MIRHETINDVTRNINYKNTKTNGGFLVYLKLTFKMWVMALNILQLIRTFSPWKSIYMIPLTFIVLVIKTPWWLFLKPFGKIYSSYTTWVGTYHSRNDVLIKSDVKKHVTHKLFGIPLLKHQSPMTQADWNYLKK